jgi:uncharacterized protein with gpF-like domain
MANAGSFQLFKDWDVQEKEWGATTDDRTRDSHEQANGQVVGIDDFFVVGGSNMMYPGDASHGAPRKEYISCRCAVLPVFQ